MRHYNRCELIFASRYPILQCDFSALPGTTHTAVSARPDCSDSVPSEPVPNTHAHSFHYIEASSSTRGGFASSCIMSAFCFLSSTAADVCTAASRNPVRTHLHMQICRQTDSEHANKQTRSVRTDRQTQQKREKEIKKNTARQQDRETEKHAAHMQHM